MAFVSCSSCVRLQGGHVEGSLDKTSVDSRMPILPFYVCGASASLVQI